MPKISVICPVYNAKEYLSRAVESVLAQTLSDFELILVDDGSVDGSGELCDELARADSRVRVIHQPNGGTSRARNAGIGAASGDYIAFIDNDDYVMPYWLEDLYAAVTRENADIARSGHYSMGSGALASLRPQTPKDLPEGCVSAPLEDKALTAREYFHKLAWWCACPIWGQLCRADLQKRCIFPEGRLAEDITVCVRLSELAQRVAFISRMAYCWTQHDSSQMHANPHMGEDSVAACDIIIEKLEQEGDAERVRYCLRRKTEILFYGPLSVACVAQNGISERARQLWQGLLKQAQRYPFSGLLPERVRAQYRLMRLSPRLYQAVIKAIYAKRGAGKR